MPAKPAASAHAGSGATKRKVKSTAKRQYPPPKNMMIRAPSGAPVDATVEDTESDPDSDDSDDDSEFESESMEIDEETGEKVNTARPLGRGKTVRSLKTTRYEYDAATLTFKGGAKHRIEPGTCVLVNFFDETEGDKVTSCHALVRTIYSVEKNNPRDRGLNGEATREEVNREGILFGVSWLLDMTHTRKLDGGNKYEPPYDIPKNELFYDPRTTDPIIPANIARIISPVVFLARRRNMSNRPGYPDPESGVFFVNKIVGKARGAIYPRQASSRFAHDRHPRRHRRLGRWRLGELRPLAPRLPRDGGHPRRASRMPAAPPQGDPIPLVTTSGGWSRL